ncbi:MAG TPA: UDP-N-acetylglucosamine--N-acetylmuramyl-(pentapeptide) pyrophosphoryl-undecaprenol N-acetylglucosamine transferase [Candidatus Baltobacteraceae bacterium]|nr:UDP-N-acetylglucosamine--N-acetylmuramyl-(pentapeptide) pyrophosphoryl-undecaprenol N-acetylglucosamine transferase [Candidatus Baltobacteraceae bacterium]
MSSSDAAPRKSGPQEIIDRLASLGRPIRIIVTGGGTGGHTFPAVTTIRTARAMLANVGVTLDALYVGTSDGLEARVAAAEGLPFIAIPAGKLRRSSNLLRMISLENLRDLVGIPIGAARAIAVVARFRPDAVLSTGGYVSLPIGLAAAILRRPLLIHEQTVRLGLANRILARGATRIALSSSSALPLLSRSMRARAIVTGNPIRANLLEGDRTRTLALFGWSDTSETLPTVYVTGGAQGSAQINRLIFAILPQLLERARVIHQCGSGSLAETKERAQLLAPNLRSRYRFLDFIESGLADVFALADVVVARSGAGTIAELSVLGKPSVLIPLIPTGGDEQIHNARYMTQAGASRALIGTEATPENLLRELEKILSDEITRNAMAESAQRIAHPRAAEILATALLELCARK